MLLEKTFILNNRKYRYLDTEKGDKTLIILHGVAGSKEGFARFTKEFSKNYRCIYLNLPGHNGMSMENCTSLDEFTDYIYDFVKFTGFSNVALIGFSFGSLVVLKVAHRFRQIGISIPVVAWAPPVKLKKIYLTKRVRLFIALMSLVSHNVYKKLLSSKAVFLVMAKAGINLYAEDAQALQYFDNENMPIFNKIMRSENLEIPLVPTFFVFGKSDIFVNDQLYHDIQLSDPKLHKKTLITGGGHFGTEAGRKQAISFIRKNLEQYL